VVVTATGSVSGTITSFDDAVNVHAGGNVDAAVVGSSDVLVQAQGDISGDVTSNHGQTWAFADGSLTGNVFAYGAAVVQADGDVSGNVFAVHGDATVLAWGNISGYIWAVDSTAWVWAGEELNPAGISAMYTVEVIALGPDNSFPFGMDTQVVDLEGDSGAQVFETQLGDSPDFVDQLRQWYDGVAAGDRQTIDDTIAAAWTTGHDIVGAFSALQGAYAESVLLNYMQGSWDAQAHGDWNQFKSWYGNLQPQDKGFWTGDLLSRGLDDGNLLSCANRVLATWDAARSDGSQFLRNQAQWDADLATERAQSRQKAQALLAQRNQFNELAITAGKAWAAEALQLNNQRKVSLLGRPDPKTARQLDVENYITASSDPGFAKNFDITLTNTAQGPSYDAVPRTDAGKALVQQWEQTKKIAGMSAIEKLGYTLNLMVTPQAQGGMREQLVSALGQEVVDRLKGLADPKNLAMMAVIGGGLTWVAGTAAGPIVIPLAGLIGYALLGTQVFEIGEDLYKGLATAIDAQTPDDFNVAAQRISDGVVKAAGTGTDLAAMAMGGAAVGKIANKLKNVKGKPKVTPDGNVKVETEGATQAKLKPTEPPGTATQSRGVWDENPLKRGARIEKRLGQNLPKNFPVIDNFENGIATSIKSLDLAAPTYLKANNVTSKVKGYIDALTGYKGNFKWGAADLRNMPVTGKVLKLAVPPNTANAAQLEALQNLVEYGRLRGITVTIVEIE
jgi:cytoskeletal protein CcmA (bactofilin family)